MGEFRELFVIQKKCNQTNRELLYPMNIEDQSIFEHCSNGLIAVTHQYWNNKMQSVLLAHGYKGRIYG